MWTSHRRFTEDGWRYLDRALDETYADFTAKVAAGRNLSPEAVEKAAKGQVWSGEDAFALGLVDRLGGYREARALVREGLGLGPDDTIAFAIFPEPRDSWKAMLEDILSGNLTTEASSSLLRSLARVARVLNAFDGAIELLGGSGRVEGLPAPRP